MDIDESIHEVVVEILYKTHTRAYSNCAGHKMQKKG